jgi:uncharacterized protein
METVGIRQLKTHLSRHLKRVRSGVRLVITERGRPIASIDPIDAPRDLEWAHKMVAEGLAHWNGGKPTGSKQPVRLKGRGGPPVRLYLDTSSLIKLYVAEVESHLVRQQVETAAVVVTSVVAYAETRATLARLRRVGRLTAASFTSAARDFDAHWPMYLAVVATDAVCREAGELAERYQLRGFDGIHLASFAALWRQGGSETHFSSFDARLNRAARAFRKFLDRN